MKYFFVLIGVVVFIREKYGNIIDEASKKYGVNSNIVVAMIRLESGGDPNAIGSKGEIGLMQLMPGTARDMGVNNPFNPRDNIFGGTKYLRYLLDIHNGNLDKAIMSYNIGPNGRNVYQGYAYLRGIKNHYRNIQSGLVF